MKTTTIIPAHNCEPSIGSVVRAALLCCDYVIVVDDASTDSTSDKATKAGAIVKRLTKNKGKAEAIGQGIDLAMLTGFDLLVTIDADGEHDPSDIPMMTEPIKKKLCSVVFGVREKTHGSCITKRVRPTQFLLNRYFNINLQDAMCGFRAYSYSAIVEIRKYLKVCGFGIDLELAVLTITLGIKFQEIPISTAGLKEYGGIRASHFDGLVENFERFINNHKTKTTPNIDWISRVRARDNFRIQIDNKEIFFEYEENDGFYYRR